MSRLSVDAVVRNARVVSPTGVWEGGVAIANGRIVALGDDDSLPPSDSVIDAGGSFLLPGVIDPHLHLQDAYYKYEQLIQTETAAAAGGGVTTVIPMMFRRSDPDESFHTVFPYLTENAGPAAHVDYGFSGIVFADQQIEEIPSYAEKYGITSFKVMMAYKGPEAEVFGVRSVDDSQIMRTMAKLRDVGYPGITMIHTENMEIVYHHKEQMIATGRDDLGAYDDARPYYAEEENLRRALFFAEITQAPLYVVHMSIGTGVQLVREARQRGVKVIAETCPHFLMFNRDDEPQGWMGKVNPPIRGKWHQDRLWDGIRRGVVSCVGSDHSTLMPYEEKMKTGMWSAMPGYPGTGEILPVLLSEGVNKGRISLQKLVEVCSTNVAKVFGLYPRKGCLQVGSDADFVIVDLDRKHTISAANHHSIAGYNLYDGIEFTGWPTMTIVRGQIVMKEDEIVGPAGHGQYVPRQLGLQKAEDVGLFVDGGDPQFPRPEPLPVP